MIKPDDPNEITLEKFVKAFSSLDIYPIGSIVVCVDDPETKLCFGTWEKTELEHHWRRIK